MRHRYKNFRVHGRIVSVIAHCLDCGKSFEDFQTARQQAREHSADTGHYVHGEVVYTFDYGNRLKRHDP